MIQLRRKSAMKVKAGKVQRKNRAWRTPNYFFDEMPSIVIDRKNPGKGHKHLARKEDVRRFVRLLPNWDELQVGLNAIVLDSGFEDCMGWHKPGVVAICAWPKEIEWEYCFESFYQEHREIFAKLNIPVNFEGAQISVHFTETTARAFQLIHVLTHEFGHHHDRMTTKSQKSTSRGESYAENYARRFEDIIIERYLQEFDI